MLPSDRSALLRYGAAVVAIAIALGVKLLLIPLVTQDAPFLLFFVAVMAAAWFGGMGPGLLATGLAALSNSYFFLRPFNAFGLVAPGVSQLILFTFEAVCVCYFCARLQAARMRVEQSAREARELERRILEISDAEQRRIGYDLHDGLGQHLTGIALLTGQLEQRLTAESSPHAPRAAKLSALAEKAVEWTHDLTKSLSPPALETLGLAEALAELAANAENIFGIECTFEQDGQIQFRDVAAAVHLYRIAQEAISNAVKHGHAKHVHVRLSSDRQRVTVRISDDGSGIEPTAQEQNGMGLRIMQYRARLIGANIQVEHGAAGGTVITCDYAGPSVADGQGRGG